MNITIREIKDTEIDDLKKVFLETVQNEFPEYSQNIRDYFTKAYFTQMMKCEIKLGAFCNKTLVGYLLANKPFGGILFVNWLAILKDYQRKGIGKIILKQIEKTALKLGAHSIHLEAEKRNLPFYKSMGFIEFGFDKEGYFGTDNYLLKKVLRKPDERNFLKDYLVKK